MTFLQNQYFFQDSFGNELIHESDDKINQIRESIRDLQNTNKRPDKIFYESQYKKLGVAYQEVTSIQEPNLRVKVIKKFIELSDIWEELECFYLMENERTHFVDGQK